MTVTTEQVVDGNVRSLSIIVDTVFPKNLNPISADEALGRQEFRKDNFEFDAPSNPLDACFGNENGPGVGVGSGSQAFVDTGWFPVPDASCVFDSQPCDSAKGIDFAGMMLPIGAAYSELIGIAKKYFLEELRGFDPVPMLIDVKPSSNGKNLGEITGTGFFCGLEGRSDTLPYGGRTAEFDVVVRFVEPKGLAAKLCDANRDGSVDRIDIQAIMAARGQTAGSNDLRDSNSDGVINVLDARTCAVMCDRPTCATN